MASPAQVGHDLRLWSGKLRGRHHQGEMLDPLCRSLIRAADLLHTQQLRVAELEAEILRLKGDQT